MTALVDQLAAEIQARIMSGDLASGTRLRQGALALEFGVSRMPVREALRQLQSSGIIEITPRRGAVVRGPSAREIREAYIVRAELEGLAAQLAADLITDSGLEQLGQVVELFRTSVEAFTRTSVSDRPAQRDAGWPAANDLFHEVVLTASGNARLRSTVEDLHRGFPRNLSWLALSENSRLLRANVEEHAVIADAIARHEPAAARDSMKRHILRSGELMTSHFERAQGANAA
jgi:DNA-binding GntR family transcriptional regulator